MSDLPSKIIIITLFVVTTPGCARLAQDEAAYLDYASRRCADDRRNFKQWAVPSGMNTAHHRATSLVKSFIP
jgi:uncharacterized lipoprotein